jgi:hypothetical protein
VNKHSKAFGELQRGDFDRAELRAKDLELWETHKSSTRRYARYRTDLPLIVKVLGPGGYVRIHGRCFEIAQAGLGAVTTTELVPGEVVSLEFLIPDGPELLVRAVVRHRMGYLHGFEFVGLFPEERERIRIFCRNLQPA